jgi:uncharacterized membrane protein
LRIFLICWACVAVVLLPLDAVWLRTMRPFYEGQLGGLLLPSPRLGAAIAFYVLYAAAVAFFAVLPNLAVPSWTTVALHGAFLGLAAYGTYDATNYATLKDFTFSVMAVDWAWGTLLTSVSATAAWLLIRKFELA